MSLITVRTLRFQREAPVSQALSLQWCWQLTFLYHSEISEWLWMRLFKDFLSLLLFPVSVWGFHSHFLWLDPLLLLLCLNMKILSHSLSLTYFRKLFLHLHQHKYSIRAFMWLSARRRRVYFPKQYGQLSFYISTNQSKNEPSKKQTTDLTYFVHAGVSFPQARNQEANDNEAKDQHSRHDQTQKSHVARTVADVWGGGGGHGCRG